MDLRSRQAPVHPFSQRAIRRAASAIWSGSRAKQRRRWPSPPGPKAPPGAAPTPASSMRLQRQRARIGKSRRPSRRDRTPPPARRSAPARSLPALRTGCRASAGSARSARQESFALFERHGRRALVEDRHARGRELDEVLDHVAERGRAPRASRRGSRSSPSSWTASERTGSCRRAPSRRGTRARGRRRRSCGRRSRRR